MTFRLLACAVLAVQVFASPARAGLSCTVFADAPSGRILKEEGPCRTRVTPASTFKIAISLMGYDSGFLKDEHTPLLPFRPGYPDWLPSWRTSTDPTSWIKNSVVWYSQQVTQSLGQERFQNYVTAFHYGNGDVSGDPGKNNGLTRAWLSSSLQISPLEQVGFLEKLVRHELPVGAHAVDMTERVTLYTTLPNGWQIHGKTGSGFPRLPNGSEDEARGYGWFVGWATRGDRTLVFARLIQDDATQKISAGYRARDAFLQELPRYLDSAAGE
jgi:beta-lactamase class D